MAAKQSHSTGVSSVLSRITPVSQPQRTLVDCGVLNPAVVLWWQHSEDVEVAKRWRKVTVTKARDVVETHRLVKWRRRLEHVLNITTRSVSSCNERSSVSVVHGIHPRAIAPCDVERQHRWIVAADAVACALRSDRALDVAPADLDCDDDVAPDDSQTRTSGSMRLLLLLLGRKINRDCERSLKDKSDSWRTP